MNPDRWRRIEELYHRALSYSGGARTSFLAESCGDDLSLRNEVQSLLDHAVSSEAFLSIREGILAESFAEPSLDRAGQRLGVFELESRAGAGGMGEVYRARDTR